MIVVQVMMVPVVMVVAGRKVDAIFIYSSSAQLISFEDEEKLCLLLENYIPNQCKTSKFKLPNPHGT